MKVEEIIEQIESRFNMDCFLWKNDKLTLVDFIQSTIHADPITKIDSPLAWTTMEIDKGICIICKKEFDRRVKGMKQRSYKIPLRPHRCLTCSTKCAVLYNRMPITKRDLLKIQGGIINMENTEVMLAEDNLLTTFKYQQGDKEVFGITILSEEKYNPSAEKGSDKEYYHDHKFMRYFKEKSNLALFEKGLKIIDEACMNEWELDNE